MTTYLSAYSMQEGQQRADTNHLSSVLSLLSTWVVMIPLESLYYKPTRGGMSIFGKHKRNIEKLNQTELHLKKLWRGHLTEIQISPGSALIEIKLYAQGYTQHPRLHFASQLCHF